MTTNPKNRKITFIVRNNKQARSFEFVICVNRRY